MKQERTEMTKVSDKISGTAQSSVNNQYLQNDKKNAENDFDSFFAEIENRRYVSERADAFVNRNEARKLGSMLDSMNRGIKDIQDHFEKIKGFQKEGVKPALFWDSRKSYHSDLEGLKQEIKKIIQYDFSEYINYQSYYGFGDFAAAEYDTAGKDLRNKEIRLALNPLALNLKIHVENIDQHLDELGVQNKEAAVLSEKSMNSVDFTLGQIHYDLSRSTQSLDKLYKQYQEKIQIGLGDQEYIENKADIVKNSLEQWTKKSDSMQIPHDFQASSSYLSLIF